MTNYNARYLSRRELETMPFASLGSDVLIEASVQLICVENIHIGSHVRIDGSVVITAPAAPVRIGSLVHIGAQCYLAGKAGIDLEDFSGLSQGVRLYSSSDDYSGSHMTNPTVPERFTRPTLGTIRLGRHGIVGSGSIVLPSVDIADGCAIGALSLVTKSTEPWGIYAGIPATRRKDRVMTLLEAERLFRQEMAND